MATHLTSKVGYRIEAPSYNLYPSRLWFCDENIIYVISCEKSNGDCIKVHPQYVGETGNSAKRRCAGHISSIVNSSQEDTTLPYQSFFIKQYESLKGKDIKSIEHGVNLKP